MPVSFDQVRAMAMALPEVEEGTSYGTPAFRVRKKFFVRLKEDGESIVLRINLFKRDYLIAAEPDAFYVTDHYRDYPAVLARLSALTPERLRGRIEDSWRLMAPKRLADAHDRQPPT
ncbi:MmcQ/YjbR family DNA-binding protein [Longimicrobium sp.]|uniref:MmcQ/YjbR family DNA-binding protein n=1 Tax=Longimicrobium sp. TaxID=2029185 RepID=UPI002BC0C75C|nr:MmcQ/YjbR family DNA-binding protein [Longimicrobium sp.]HSU18066.1 MmcQ/YjbR family DNA-binding protein [Longimicrobium sp.]